MGTIDVTRHVSDMERVLRGEASQARRVEALAVLERWQWDEMLDTASRARARDLVREFGSISQRAGVRGLWPPVRPVRLERPGSERRDAADAIPVRTERELRLIRRV